MNTIATNRRAYYDYEIQETWEAGVVLLGLEIKSVCAKKVAIDGAYVQVNSEAWLVNASIEKYESARDPDYDPLRRRKLLLRKTELVKLRDQVRQKGVTAVPLRVYLDDNGRAKVEIGLAVGKKKHDKRETIKRRDADLEMRRAK